MNTVTLYIKGHCIETAAKNEFRRISGLFLETEDDAEGELAAQVGLLREFIETADWSSLRASDERLAGTRPGVCTIEWMVDGRPGIKEVHDLDG